VAKKAELNAFCLNHHRDLSNDTLSGEDWEIIELTERFLKPFHAATLTQQGNWSGLDQALLNMDLLLKHYELSKQKFANNKHLIDSIEMGWVVMETYYTKSDSTPVYATALLLHPERRLKYIQANWKPEWWEAIKDRVYQLWEQYCERALPLETTPRKRKERDPDDVYDNLLNSLNVAGLNDDNGDEFERFINDKPLIIEDITPLKWWEAQRLQYPRLSGFARDILSISPMSDEPERIFSSARRVLSWDRARLDDKVLERLQCIKHWKKNGHISRFIPSEVALETGK
jgi:hypothetical protein